MSIKFSLICECSAKFEGWFPSNKEYEKQLATGKVMCPMCDSTNVRKDIMSPSIKRKSTARKKGKERVDFSFNTVKTTLSGDAIINTDKESPSIPILSVAVMQPKTNTIIMVPKHMR